MPGGGSTKKKNTLDNTQALPRGLPSHQNTYVFDRVNHVYHWLFLCSWVGQFEHFGMCQNHPLPPNQKKKTSPRKKVEKERPDKNWIILFLDFYRLRLPRHQLAGVLWHSAQWHVCHWHPQKTMELLESRCDFRSTRAQWLVSWTAGDGEPIAQIHSRKASFVLEGTDVSKEQTWTKGLNPPTNHWMIYYIKHIVQQKCVQSSVPL